MNRAEIIAEMSRRGYTHVETYGGPVPLGKWRPEIYSPIPASAWSAHISNANEVWEDADRAALWTFTRYEFMDCPTCNLTFSYDAALGKPAGCTYCDR